MANAINSRRYLISALADCLLPIACSKQKSTSLLLPIAYCQFPIVSRGKVFASTVTKKDLWNGMHSCMAVFSSSFHCSVHAK